MFGRGTASYFEHLPTLPGLSAPEARRILSLAYADVLAVRDSFDREAGPASDDVVTFLRRLAAALEAHGVFPQVVGSDERRGAAFIAAESIALTIGTPAVDAAPAEEPDGAVPAHYQLRSRSIFEAIEAGLLYMIAGFESNAALTVASIPGAEPRDETAEARAGEAALEAIAALLRLSTLPPEQREIRDDPEASLRSRARTEALKRLASAASTHLQWLRGGDTGARDASYAALVESIDVLAAASAARYADLLHLSHLLRHAIDETAQRSLRGIPAPADERYAAYVTARAMTRPLVWPSATTFASECLPGPRRHAVVSLPTGSGKSFIAEIAVSQALLESWVLYLVPTNALAAQVRRDLAQALAVFEDATVRAFIGGAEYTELSGEAIADVEPGNVMVMTPEKCALALRRSEEAFAAVGLCVFDECHLIGESGTRGALAELVAAHVLAVAPDVRFVLLSAMVSNPGDAAAWLEGVTGVEAVPIETPWRPTRTLRGVLGFERGGFIQSRDEARARLAELPRHRVNMAFDAPYAALVNLQGAWTELADDEYALLRLGASGTLNLHRSGTEGNWEYEVEDDGYLNPTLADVTTVLCRRGERVLAFSPRDKNHAFAVASSIDLQGEVELGDSADGRLIEAYLQLAALELGAPSIIGQLIRNRVAVHSSALIDSERTAAELAFQRRVAHAMVATGTLAQGLNLPATAVVVGGTQIGYSAEPEDDTESRTRAQLLNAIGRSGRPGIANHGVALVIPNDAITFDSGHLNTRAALDRAGVLAFEDASVPLQSRLGTLVALARDGRLVEEAMSIEEMVAYTYLPEDPLQANLARQILRRTLAIQSLGDDQPDAVADRVADELQRIGQEFVAAADVPEWTTEVAYRSGLALGDVFQLYRACLARADEPPEPTVDAWFELLVDVLSRVPQQRIRGLLFPRTSLKSLRFEALAAGDDAAVADAWPAFAETMRLFLAGAPIVEIAAYATAAEPPIDETRTVGAKPIPKTVGFLQDMSFRLSMLAGGVSALWLVGREQDDAGPWELSDQQEHALNMLPLAIRCGAADPSALAWFRFGLRHRVAAHRLSQAFPVPDDLPDDTAVRQWVWTTRQAWINDELEADAIEVAVARPLRAVAGYEQAV